MTARIRWFLARLNGNYWFYPALFSLISALLAMAMVWIDREGLAGGLHYKLWLVPERPEGASTMLNLIAGSMIGITATVFSITIAAVAFASGNFGPRLLTNFMEDRGNQLSLGVFIATFVYATLVLGTVRGVTDTGPQALAAATGFVPQISLLMAYVLLALSVAVLVYFLNHVPASIRINTVLEKIGQGLLKRIGQAYPECGASASHPDRPSGQVVYADASGYIQLIDFAAIGRIGANAESQIVLHIRTGDFVHPGVPLADVCGGSLEDGPLGDSVAADLRDAFTLGAIRTSEQDPQFLIDELVEIGLRALSPGINDPFTAVTALHWLGAAIAEIGQRKLVLAHDVDESEDCHVLPLPDDFTHFIRRSFNAIRSGVAANPIAALVMFDVLHNAAGAIPSAKRRGQLLAQAVLLREQARHALDGPDLKQVERAFDDCGTNLPACTLP